MGHSVSQHNMKDHTCCKNWIVNFRLFPLSCFVFLLQATFCMHKELGELKDGGRWGVNKLDDGTKCDLTFGGVLLIMQ